MDFCVITPIAALDRYATLSKTHLVLAQILSPFYKRFYRERKRKGDRIILDNGAYEQQGVTPDRLLNAVQIYTPDIVAFPDHMGDATRTLELSKEFLHLLNDTPLISPPDRMVVPQAPASASEQWWRCLHNLMEWIEPQWVALPRNMPSIFENRYARVRVIETIAMKYPKTRLHAFGMADGDIEEMKELSAMGVESIDSSAPVWRGWNGFNLLNSNWDDIPFDPFSDYPFLMREQLILHNLEVCGVDTSVFSGGI